jgi:hypothetical protein
MSREAPSKWRVDARGWHSAKGGGERGEMFWEAERTRCCGGGAGAGAGVEQGERGTRGSARTPNVGTKREAYRWIDSETREVALLEHRLNQPMERLLLLGNLGLLGEELTHQLDASRRWDLLFPSLALDLIDRCFACHHSAERDTTRTPRGVEW